MVFDGGGPTDRQITDPARKEFQLNYANFLQKGGTAKKFVNELWTLGHSRIVAAVFYPVI